MKFFVKHLKATRSGVLVMLAMQGFLFLFGVLIVVVINAFFNDDRDYAAIGSMMALMGTIFGGMLRSGGGMHRYQTAVSMGSTRLSYILADPAITALNCVVGIAFAWVLNQIELWAYGLLYPGWTLQFDVFRGVSVDSDIFKLEWWFYLLLIVGICVLDFLFGALQLRFGAKGFAAVWFPICFAPMIISNSLRAVQEGGSSLLAQIGKGILFLAGLLTPPMWSAVGLAVLLGLIALSVVCYRTSEVKM